ncbi:MAG: dTDP-glucose 4,6-dehydratase [Patescibacteria group bacterium]
MRIFVTGGAGFMGSNFVHYLLGKYPGYEVLNFDKLTYAGNLENVRDLETDKRYQFIKGDIADEKAVRGAMEAFKPDAVINYAAETHVDRSIQAPRDFLFTDVIGTYTLLEAVREFNVTRFIQISTDEVYGSTTQGKFSEESSFNPSSPYSASKAGGDHMVMAYWRTYKAPVIRTHSCNNFGPFQYPEKIISLFITNILEGKKAPLYQGGEKNVREWIYVEDHCRAIDHILHYGELGEVYNIGSGDEIANIDLTKRLLQLLHVGEEMIEYVTDRPGHDYRYALDSNKLRELGWAPKWSFEEALAETVEWYKTHAIWWKKLKNKDFDKYYKKQYGERV